MLFRLAVKVCAAGPPDPRLPQARDEPPWPPVGRTYSSDRVTPLGSQHGHLAQSGRLLVARLYTKQEARGRRAKRSTRKSERCHIHLMKVSRCCQRETTAPSEGTHRWAGRCFRTWGPPGRCWHRHRLELRLLSAGSGPQRGASLEGKVGKVIERCDALESGEGRSHGLGFRTTCHSGPYPTTRGQSHAMGGDFWLDPRPTPRRDRLFSIVRAKYSKVPSSRPLSGGC